MSGPKTDGTPTQDTPDRKSPSLDDLLATLPQEMADNIAEMITTITWPKSEPSQNPQTQPHLHVGLIDADNSVLKSAMRAALSRKTFIRFIVRKCKPSPPKSEPREPYLLPRVISDQYFQHLQNLDGLKPTTIEMTATVGCDCKDLHNAWTTVFVLDELTTLLFVWTMSRKFLRSWHKLDVTCHIQHQSVATAVEDFLDFVLKTVPAKKADSVIITDHPNIENGVDWVSYRLVKDPTQQQKITKTELQLKLIEDISEKGLFLNQKWSNTTNKVVQLAFDWCLRCALRYSELLLGSNGPLSANLDETLQIRVRCCILFSNAIVQTIEKYDRICLKGNRFFANEIGEDEFCHYSNDNPYNLAPNDLAMSLYLVDEFCFLIRKIPPCQQKLLELICAAQQIKVIVMIKLAQYCKRGGTNNGQPFTVGDIWFWNMNGGDIPGQDDPMEAIDFLEAAKEDMMWLRDHFDPSYQSLNEHNAWRRRVHLLLDEYLEIRSTHEAS